MNDESQQLLSDDVRELLRLICQTDITELSLERGEAKIHVKRTLYGTPAPVAAPAMAATAPVAAGPAADVFAAPSGTPINSPMVGTFYASPSPKDPPYVKVGDEVHPGDVVGIVEAMKMMNEIECEIHGRVTAINVENAQPVEYGQVLMTITPLE
ncbi:MAG TPA: acetyl-CoA carboxylase biotin carboxyl carrier protein [Herpetosiphonaceae bacterium]|nr:acetyl-CoA carboxylase biotin carboxyl carrier protein [Herpetosiphonaceae bacterium]